MKLMATQSTNVTLQKSNVTKENRSKVFTSKQKTGCTIWLTGFVI
jgi:adenylylsulfate kinase-like enzyme